MACFHPWTQIRPGMETRPLACGQCIGCRLAYSREWATRCINEAQLHGINNEYVTLTYNDENLPPNQNLRYRDYQLFMKRLRQWRRRNELKSKQEPTKGTPPLPQRATKSQGNKFPEKHVKDKNEIRFYMSGEYGGQDGRPHFHAILFNIRFPDRVKYKKNHRGEWLYKSAILEKLWGKGYCTTGGVTWESAAYVARYVVKKISGETNAYDYVDELTGEIKQRRREFANMSRRPGIGMPWIKKYTADVYPAGKIVINGKEINPPKQYDRWYKTKNPKKHRAMVERRLQEERKNLADSNNQRLATKQLVKQAQLNQLKRKI